MPDSSHFAAFLIAALVLIVIPGPAVLYIVTRSVAQGRRAGLFSALGVATGGLVHVAAAAFGLSALLLSSALAFSLVKYVGAAYLIFLGVRKLAGKDDPSNSANELEAHSPIQLFRHGVLVNVLNPKTALFFFAFLPQFVNVSNGSVARQMLLLGIIFVSIGIVSDGLWAILAGSIGSSLRRHAAWLSAQRYISGTVFVGLGLATAFSGAGKHK